MISRAKLNPTMDPVLTTASSFNASEKLRQSESDHGPPTPMDRAGSLARLDLISHQTRTSTNDTRLQEALKDHFVRHQDKDIVAMDLEPYIRSLSLSGRVAFATVLHEVLSSSGNEMRSADVGSKPTLAAPSESYAALDDHLVDTLLTFRQTNAREHLTWLRIATNAVTVDRLLMSQTLPTVIGDPSKHANVIQSLTSYATLAFDLYSRACRVNELSPERTPASGAAKSALGNLFWALTAIHGTTHDASISSLRSLCYLLPSRTQSTTEWRIQLISDLQRQGASSYAWSFYDDMDIRHITVDAAAPLMFCRVSMINLSGSNGFRPYIDIGKHLEPYRDALNRIPHHQDMALDRDHEAQCIGMHDLLNEMRDSPVRWMLGLERRRIARLQRLQFEEDDLKHAPEHLPRTLSSATRKPWAYATGLITSTYVYFLAHLDDLSRLATCEPAIEAGILEQVRARQAEYLHETSITDDLQREERAVLSSYKRLTLVFGGLLAGSPDLVLEALQQLVKKVDALRSLPPQKSTNSVPSYQYHLQCSLSLELIDILLRTCKKVSLRMKGGKVKASVSSVETISKKAAEAIRSQLRKRIGELNELSKKQDLAKELAAPASLQQLTDHVISTLGKDSSEAHLRETVVSCRLSLESLLNIKCG